MDTVHEGVIMHMVYHYLVKNYDNPLSFFTVVWCVNARLESKHTSDISY